MTQAFDDKEAKNLIQLKNLFRGKFKPHDVIKNQLAVGKSHIEFDTSIKFSHM